MAREAVPITQITEEGTAPPAFTNGAPDGHRFENDGRTIVEIKNAGAAPLAATFVTPREEAGLDVEDRSVSVPAGQSMFISRLRSDLFNQPVGSPDQGQVYVDYPDGDETDLQIRCLRA